MGLCGSKTTKDQGAVATNQEAPSLVNNLIGSAGDKIKEAVLKIVVEQSTGGENDSQFGFVKNLISGMVPNSQVTQKIVPGGSPSLFTVTADGQQLHSTEKDGPVQNNNGLVDKIKSMAMSKMGSLM